MLLFSSEFDRIAIIIFFLQARKTIVDKRGNILIYELKK